jgi:hypothetical protein
MEIEDVLLFLRRVFGRDASMYPAKNKKTLTRLIEIENVLLFLRRVNAFYSMSH